MSRISKAFSHLHETGSKALIPYIMAGDPSLEATKKYISDLEAAGADIIELGVPFSDPLADGPTIQRASERALKHGTTLKKVLALVTEIRKTSEIPIILMTYYNLIFHYGVRTFVQDAVKAGVDGVIIPDLIPDEADELIVPARKYGLDTIFLLAPTSTKDRIAIATKAATGFIYYVSMTGITGSRLTTGKAMRDTLNSIRKDAGKPVAIGFGVSTPDEAAKVAVLADGVIVGSAIVKRIAEGKDIKKFVRSLKNAISKNRAVK
ncbi:MAG: tryptophan synthase subunit alpha [Nitrospira sp.]|nr:tryptophan synthase subunit alpha [bacterium]MBL7050218.1 tryptophan synthase subunit alpha [Nitrospira sp.]